MTRFEIPEGVRTWSWWMLDLFGLWLVGIFVLSLVMMVHSSS